MVSWLRLAGLVAVLAIGESCGLKGPAVPHLDVRTGAVSPSGPPRAARTLVSLTTPAGALPAEPGLLVLRPPSR
jgi:hypothetical protein